MIVSLTGSTMPTDPDRVRHPFLAARELPLGLRAAFLSQACGGDTALREEVERLLAAHDASKGGWGGPVPLSQLVTNTDHPSERPTRPYPAEVSSGALGMGAGALLANRYTLLEEIGMGGMGTVWAAQQSEPVRRRVAVKLVNAGMDSKSVLARFEQERQALALMDHPNIAKVFDAGLTATGQPFFVMELVDGQPLTTFCDQARLAPRQRLELFVPICQAVQHAHQKGIIHRDLKPSNILVSFVDGKPAPKVIDFGVAKATEGGQLDMPMATQLGAVIGTLEYMAPEQAGFLGTDIDTRADIYSLGVVLYELLTGQRPIDVRRLKMAAMADMIRLIQEEDPPKPSKRLSTEATLNDVASARHTEPGKLLSMLRGDLDWVVMKCLEKQRDRRYASANGLARDIQRFLADEVVEARPPSTGYRLGKFLRRHRVPVLAGATVALALIAGLTAFAWQANVARQQRDIARTAEQAEGTQRRLADRERDRAVAAESQAQQDRNGAQSSASQALRDRNLALQQKHRADSEAAAAKAVNEFLQNDLLAQASADNQSGPTSKPDPDLKVRTALDRAAERIAGKFDRQPGVEAAIRNTLGRTYNDLGQYPEAVKHLQRALELYRRNLGVAHPKTLDTMNQLGSVYRKEGKYPQAEALCKQVLEISRRALGPEHPDTLNGMFGLATVYDLEGKYPQAEALHLQVLELRRRVLGPEHPDTLESMNNLAAVYDMQGKYPQSAALYSRTLEVRRRLLGPEHPKTLWSMNELAWVYVEQGSYAQAETLYLQTLEGQGRVLGPEHPNTLSSMNGLAYLYLTQNKPEQAEALWSQALEISRRVLGPEHPNTLAFINNLAEVCDRQGKYAQAETLNIQAIEVRRRVLGPEHPDTLSSTGNLANVYAMQGKYAQAEVLQTQTLEIRRRVLGPEHPDTLNALAALATMFQRQGKPALAERYASEVLAGRKKVLGPDHSDTLDVAASLALAYQSQGKFNACETLERQAVEFDRQKRPDDWRRFRSESLLGASLVGQRKFAEAEPLLLEGYQGMVARKDNMAAQDWYYLGRTLEWVVKLYVDWGKPEKVASWQVKLQAMNAAQVEK